MTVTLWARERPAFGPASAEIVIKPAPRRETKASHPQLPACLTPVWPSRSTAPPSRSTVTRKLAPACNNYAGRSEVGSHLTLSREGCRQPDGGEWRTRRPVVAARAEKPPPSPQQRPARGPAAPAVRKRPRA